MHGDMDALHMLDLHTKLTHKKEISWSELESMLPFEKDAYINILIKTLENENDTKKANKPMFDIPPEMS